jgi:hypothetical protein
MRHATADTLEALADLLTALRGIGGIKETRPGAFSRGSRAFLHFHDDPTGYYADVRFGSEFERVRVTTKREQQALVSRLRDELRRDPSSSSR